MAVQAAFQAMVWTSAPGPADRSSMPGQPAQGIGDPPGRRLQESFEHPFLICQLEFGCLELLLKRPDEFAMLIQRGAVLSHTSTGVDHTTGVRMLAQEQRAVPQTRDQIYQPGLPAKPGYHYGAFVRFAAEHAGETVLDLGCGYDAYSLALREAGRRCIGCDVSLDYLRAAVSSGLPVAAVDSALPFGDRSFDTVLLFEVIEHVPEIEMLLKEAFRIARKNVLVTVPNAEDIELLKGNDVTYAHMLSSDHVHFFDAPALQQLLARFSGAVSVRRGDPIYPFWFLSRSVAYYALRVLYRAGILKPRFFCRLYGVASVRQD